MNAYVDVPPICPGADAVFGADNETENGVVRGPISKGVTPFPVISPDIWTGTPLNGELMTLIVYCGIAEM